MDKHIYEGKNLEEAKNKALDSLKVTTDDIIINILESKQGLLKKCVKIEVIDINEVINYLKESLATITKLMGVEINLEVRKREKNIEIKIFSNNNAILIGKNGRTLDSFQTIIRQIAQKYIKDEYKITLDIENYKDNKISNIERLAKKIAKEVKLTKIPTKMDNMNSFERRAVHNILSNNKFVYTESEGEEPNRYVVIKPKED